MCYAMYGSTYGRMLLLLMLCKRYSLQRWQSRVDTYSEGTSSVCSQEPGPSALPIAAHVRPADLATQGSGHPGRSILRVAFAPLHLMSPPHPAPNIQLPPIMATRMAALEPSRHSPSLRPLRSLISLLSCACRRVFTSSTLPQTAGGRPTRKR